VVALLSAAMVAAATVSAAGAFPYPVHRRTLGNGLEVILVPYDSPGLAAYFTAFRVGSRDEVEKGRSGFAHFFEHLSFRGTRAHSGDDWERITKSLGYDSNAYTEDDATVYWLAGPTAGLPTIIDLEADRFMNLAYSEDDFKIEARAVLGELLKDLSSPDFKLFEVARERAFSRHTYRHGAMGFERDVRAMPSGYLYSLELYRRFYRPDNATVVVVGDFDEERTFRDIERAFGSWQGTGQPVAVEPEPAQVAERQVRIAFPTPILPRLYSGWHTPGAADPAAVAAQLVLWPFLFARPSALYRELVLERHLVEEIGGEYEPHRDPFLFGCELVLKNAAAEGKARAAVDRAIADVAAGRIDLRLLADVKSNVLASLVMETDTPYRTGVWLLYYRELAGDPGYLEGVMERVRRVSPEDLSVFARRWLSPPNRTTVFMSWEPRGRSPRPLAGLGGGAP